MILFFVFGILGSAIYIYDVYTDFLVAVVRVYVCVCVCVCACVCVCVYVLLAFVCMCLYLCVHACVLCIGTYRSGGPSPFKKIFIIYSTLEEK